MSSSLGDWVPDEPDGESVPAADASPPSPVPPPSSVPAPYHQETDTSDSSDTSESDEDDGNRPAAKILASSSGGGHHVAHCPAVHEGREMLSMVVPAGVDDVFTLLFTNSSFLLDFLQTTRKSTDLQMGQWQEGDEDRAVKMRTISYNLPIGVNIGVKLTRTVETQTLADFSRAGELYAVNTEVSNSGVPVKKLTD